MPAESAAVLLRRAADHLVGAPPCPCCHGDRLMVCDACGQHACWAGQFMCEDAHTAGVTTERAEVRDA